MIGRRFYFMFGTKQLIEVYDGRQIYSTFAKADGKARMVISSLNLIEIWEKAGATINPVGSFRIGVLAKHRDIDFHIYTDSLDIGRSFAIIAELCRHKGIKKCTFANLAETDECCFEWHLYYEDDEAQTWQIDLIQIKKGSFYDGYFEKTAEKIIAAMTEEQRKTILRLKFETPDELKISGIEYYKAVIQDGVQTPEDLLRWRQTHRFDGIIEW